MGTRWMASRADMVATCTLGAVSRKAATSSSFIRMAARASVIDEQHGPGRGQESTEVPPRGTTSRATVLKTGLSTATEWGDDQRGAARCRLSDRPLRRHRCSRSSVIRRGAGSNMWAYRSQWGRKNDNVQCRKPDLPADRRQNHL